MDFDRQNKVEAAGAIAGGGHALGPLDVIKPTDEPIGAANNSVPRLQIAVGGQTFPLKRYWHMDSDEKRDGRWQVVWSQATEIE